MRKLIIVALLLCVVVSNAQEIVQKTSNGKFRLTSLGIGGSLIYLPTDNHIENYNYVVNARYKNTFFQLNGLYAESTTDRRSSSDLNKYWFNSLNIGSFITKPGILEWKGYGGLGLLRYEGEYTSEVNELTTHDEKIYPVLWTSTDLTYNFSKAFAVSTHLGANIYQEKIIPELGVNALVRIPGKEDRLRRQEKVDSVQQIKEASAINNKADGEKSEVYVHRIDVGLGRAQANFVSEALNMREEETGFRLFNFDNFYISTALSVGYKKNLLELSIGASENDGISYNHQFLQYGRILPLNQQLAFEVFTGVGNTNYSDSIGNKFGIPGKVQLTADLGKLNLGVGAWIKHDQVSTSHAVFLNIGFDFEGY
ncbi:hypothetical protein [Nonlabens xiamenensis]|uniref:hypothetical protein n=1 Tax=Nonlabens xiamenensis TaxID=2341043 RepID=UPI000F610787|nr:hypothetical protein [Nonlabens xiamenensis]